MIKWLKSKFLSPKPPPTGWIVKYQISHSSPWQMFKVANTLVIVRTKKEAKEHARRLNGEGMYDTKIVPVRRPYEKT